MKTMALWIDWLLTFLFSLLFTSHAIHFVLIFFVFSLIFPVALSLFPLTRLSLCSLLVQASMKVWAMTESEASTTSDTWTSKVKWGFLRMFTQNRKGRLRGGKGGEKAVHHRGCYHYYCFRMGENLINHITSMNSFESGRHFMCESTCLRCNWVQYKVITGMERSLSCRCQFIQNNTLDCHLILLFHMILTSLRIIAVQWKWNEKEKDFTS